MIQRFVRTADLDKVYAAAGKVLAARQRERHEAGGLQVLLHPERGALASRAFVAKPTPELLKLQADLIAAVAPFTVETGPIGAFTAPHDDPAIDAGIDRIRFDVRAEGCRRAISIRTSAPASLPAEYLDKMLAEPFEPFTFSPAGAAVYQLGPFGTAAKKLKELALKP